MFNKLAVIGLGNIANRHRSNLNTLYPNAQIFAMSSSGRIPTESISHCDVIVESVQDLIDEKVELAIVASPAPFHVSHAIPLIEAGIPVLVEKPVTVSMEEGKRLKVALEQNSTPIAIGYCLRYLPSAIHMKQLIGNKELGCIYNVFVEIGQYLPDWRPNKNYRESVSAQKKLGGGALNELSHELDYCQWLLGSLNLKYASLRKSAELALEVEDCVDIISTTTDEAIVNIHLDFLQKKAHRRCRFLGSKGTLEWDLIKNEITFSDVQSNKVIYSQPDWDKNQMYLDMIQDFVAQIKGKDSNIVTLDDALGTVEFIQSIKSKYPLNKISTL